MNEQAEQVTSDLSSGISKTSKTALPNCCDEEHIDTVRRLQDADRA